MSSSIVETLARVAVSGGLVAVVLRQCRKPSRWVGGAFLAIMNRSHVGVTTWGLAHVAIAPDATVLDVGCGGGRTVATLAAATPQGHVDGVDYSAESIAVARRTNADAIARGCVTITLASVAALPFPDAHFDLVTAFRRVGMRDGRDLYIRTSDGDG